MNARADTLTARRVEFSDRLRMLLTQRSHALIPEQLVSSLAGHAFHGVTPQSFSNWLNGVQIPQRTNIDALAKWLNVTSEYLANGVPLLHFAPAKHGDVDVQQLVDDFMKLDAYGRRVAKALMASLARLKGGGA